MAAFIQKLIAFFTAILAFFGLVKPGSAHPDPVVWDDTAGYAVEGGEIEFSFRENPSTGYAWAYEVAGGAVALSNDDYVQDPAAPGMAGVGGTRYLRFAAAEPGTATVEFTYARSWETEPPIDAYRAVIEVAADLSVRLVSFEKI